MKKMIFIIIFVFLTVIIGTGLRLSALMVVCGVKIQMMASKYYGYGKNNTGSVLLFEHFNIFPVEILLFRLSVYM